MAATASSSQYAAVYEKLEPVKDGQLRLIILQPGQRGSAIKCDLVVAPITQEYEALSYTWGLPIPQNEATSQKQKAGDEWEDVDETVEAAEQFDALSLGESVQKSTITVNGQSMSVMINLSLALQHLRNTEETRTLWVDYLCINHEDIQDRNTQVAQMDTIYLSAARVVVWLGLERPNCDQAVGELLGLAANMHLTAIYPGTTAETRARLRPVIELLQRAWFSRVWVAQEVALAKEVVVQIGKRAVPWEWFLRAARVYRDHMECCASIVSPFSNHYEGDEFLALRNGLASILGLDGEALRGITLHTVLRLFYGRLATDPRDKVYGLLGLLRKKARLIDADYALSARQVYEETAFRIIELSGDLSVLIDIDEYAGDVELASWAPDWTSTGIFGLDMYDSFKTAGSLRADARRCSAHTLKISGLIFDTVTEVVQDDEREGEEELLRAANRLEAWEKLAEEPCSEDAPSPYASGQERKDALWQTVLMGMSADRSRRLIEDGQDSEDYQNWRQWLKRYSSTKSAASRRKLLETGSKEPALDWQNSMLSSYPNARCFFKTGDGYFGLGPVEMEEGDAVCVLYGGKMPFVLRAIDEACDECDNDQLCYKLVGFAYVHGIMDGETVQGIEADEQEGIEFCIR